MSYSLRQIAPESKLCHDLHLDVFDQIIPFSVISQVLSTCNAWEMRERTLNMVVVIWVIIAMGLLPNLSIPHVLQKIAKATALHLARSRHSFAQSQCLVLPQTAVRCPTLAPVI